MIEIPDVIIVKCSTKNDAIPSAQTTPTTTVIIDNNGPVHILKEITKRMNTLSKAKRVIEKESSSIVSVKV